VTTRPGQISVIGCDGGPLRPDAAAALAAAAHVAGARRHLDQITIPPGAGTTLITNLDRALDEICAQPGPVAVLASGDPGFFGIVRALRARGARPAVYPAVSSVALAFARLGLDWDDALVVSAHGRDPGPALAAALAHPKAAILTAPGTAPALAAALLAAGRTVHAAECLGTARERVRELTAEPTALTEPNVLISLGDASTARGGPRWLAGHLGAPRGWALPEEEFGHRDSMITKAETRALVLARLAPAPGRTIWDVGAGSGSVSVECARFGARVIAIESDPGQCERIRDNAARHAVTVTVVHGRAPGCLDGMPPADAVFAGGGGGEVLSAAIRAAGRPARVVATLAAVDRVTDTAGRLAALGYRPGGVQLQASRLSPFKAGAYRLAAQNPVFVLWGERDELA
jgi:precorrin-6B C5,15-methyltransferase / cobalt-precorrin-6B C5,C15-methyltransferase